MSYKERLSKALGFVLGVLGFPIVRIQDYQVTYFDPVKKVLYPEGQEVLVYGIDDGVVARPPKGCGMPFDIWVFNSVNGYSSCYSFTSISLKSRNYENTFTPSPNTDNGVADRLVGQRHNTVIPFKNVIVARKSRQES